MASIGVVQILFPLRERLAPPAGTEAQDGPGAAGAVEAVAVEAVAVPVHEEEVQLQGGHHEPQDIGNKNIRVAAYY